MTRGPSRTGRRRGTPAARRCRSARRTRECHPRPRADLAAAPCGDMPVGRSTDRPYPRSLGSRVDDPGPKQDRTPTRHASRAAMSVGASDAGTPPADRATQHSVLIRGVPTRSEQANSRAPGPTEGRNRNPTGRQTEGGAPAAPPSPTDSAHVCEPKFLGEHKKAKIRLFVTHGVPCPF